MWVVCMPPWLYGRYCCWELVAKDARPRTTCRIFPSWPVLGNYYDFWLSVFFVLNKMGVFLFSRSRTLSQRKPFFLFAKKKRKILKALDSTQEILTIALVLSQVSTSPSHWVQHPVTGIIADQFTGPDSHLSGPAVLGTWFSCLLYNVFISIGFRSEERDS